MSDSNDRNETLAEFRATQLRDAVLATAAHLRRIAEELERSADEVALVGTRGRRSFGPIAERAIHAVSWGVANARLERIALAAADADIERVQVPSTPEPTMAWVSVDDRGRLTPESMVTVGEWTWPVPERVEASGVMAPGRIGEALRERGYRMVRLAEHDRSRPGEIGIPVERINDK